VEYWNLILFNEHEREDGTLMWLMRKNQCMHCAEPGCLEACPSDGAIVQYTNGIVDFSRTSASAAGIASQAAIHIPKFNKETKRVYKCTLCTDRVSQGLEPACIKSCPTGCLHFGSKDDMKYLANSGQNSYATTTTFRRQESTIHRASVALALSMCCMTRVSRTLRRFAKDPRIPLSVKLWKGPLKWLGTSRWSAV